MSAADDILNALADLVAERVADRLRAASADGARNGCSILYGAVRRAAKALGYLRGVTYTLVEEGGASLRAAGWREDGRTPGRSWDGPSRPREDKHTLGARIRWVVTEVGWDERGERPRVVAANDADETLSLFRDGAA